MSLLLALLSPVAVAEAPASVEFTVEEQVTDRKISKAREPLLVGTTQHAELGRLELWCSGPAKKGNYTCEVRKQGSSRVAAATVAAAFIPGGAVVSAAVTGLGQMK